jgi:hypothetical protein
MDIVNRIGSNDWPAVATQMCGRNARQCRERWTNYINPVIVNAPWTKEEEKLLEEKFEEYGTRWQAIAIFFPTRSKNHIKNHWSSHQKRRPNSKAAMERDRRAEENSADEIEDRRVPVRAPTLCDVLFPEPQNEEICWEDIYGGLF